MRLSSINVCVTVDATMNASTKTGISRTIRLLPEVPTQLATASPTGTAMITSFHIGFAVSCCVSQYSAG